MHNSKGLWLDIVDYSRHTGKSVSTIRRHIKAEKVKHRRERGKFYIFCPKSENIKGDGLIKLENERLKKQIREMAEENTDLKMLVQIYEGQRTKSDIEVR